jgi:general secretion pathway protein D
MLRALMVSGAFTGAFLAVAGCAKHNQALEPLPQTGTNIAGVASPRVNGIVAMDQGVTPAPQIAEGRALSSSGTRSTAQQNKSGDVMLNFADTDIREVIRQILGDILQVNYAIDPAVRGTATIETQQPVPKAELLTTLQALLSQNGATLVQSGGLYRVVPSSVAMSEPSMAGDVTFGSQVEDLHYTSARDLARVLQPFIGTGARIAPDPGRNALLISGEPGARSTILNMVHAFDIDVMANQSYALFPVTSGDPGKVAAELQKVFQTEGDGALAGLVRVIPMERVNAVLVVSAQRKYIDDARRLFQLVDRARRVTARSWHVYYVQNGQSGDLANMLQRAFNPHGGGSDSGNTGGTTAPGQDQSRISGSGPQSQDNGSGFNNSGQGGPNGSNGMNGTQGTMGSPMGSGLGGASSGGIGGNSGPGGRQVGGAGSGDDLPMPLAESDSLSQQDEGNNTNAIRIIANRKNNAILYYATADEASTIEGMLHKIDIVPLQVRIDATIAEVTLNDNLKYGTQFYFQSGGINGLLTEGTVVSKSPAGDLPGFVLSKGTSAVHATISALQAVTNVRVLSSPQLLVLDNEMARLQVGDNVPYLTQTAQSTLTSTADVISSVSYQETGVILQVVPKVNSGGLVTLDISQEVSDVATTSSSNIDSPTFSERKVRSHVVIQDGQTVGLAGLIRDNVSRGNSGIPYLKDIPVVGALFGTQNNTRQRTELLILITPHVLQDQQDARALTQDMREKLTNAGLVPQELDVLPVSGSDNPNAVVSRKHR